MKKRKQLRTICWNLKKSNPIQNTIYLWNLLLDLAYLKNIVEILKYSVWDVKPPFVFSEKKNISAKFVQHEL
jgi:hypothetical protein